MAFYNTQNGISRMGDLSKLGRKIKSMIRRFFPRDDDPSFMLLFNLQENRQDFHWVSNVDRLDAVKMLEDFCKHQRQQMN